MSTTSTRTSSADGPLSLADLVGRHPVVAFVVLTYAISFGIWFLAPILGGSNPDVQRQVWVIGAFGPALAATLLSAVCDPERVRAEPLRRAVLFTVVLGFGCLVWYLLYSLLPGFGWRPGLWWLDVLSAAVAAYFVACRLSRFRGTRALLVRLTNWRRLGLRWWLFALLFWPALVALDGVLARLFGMTPSPISPLLTDLGAWPRFVVAAAATLLYGGGLEEPGWRGFALSRLQERYSLLVATVFVGLMWAFWHGPAYYGVSAASLVAIAPMALSTITTGFLYTWVYNRTGGSVLAVVLFHTLANSAGTIFLPAGATPRLVAALLGIALVFLDRMWRTNR